MAKRSPVRQALADVRRRADRAWQERVVRPIALSALIRRTGNFRNVTWLGRPVWQNLVDVWMLQDAIVDGDVDLVIECGTNRGGSAYFMASVFDLLGRGHVITIDVADLVEFEHRRIDFVRGSSTAAEVVEKVRARVAELNPKHVVVLLDSDHAGPHVERELELYSEFVGVGDYIVVQDGCIDELRMFRSARPGPLWALDRFVARDGRFEVDTERSGRYLLSHSPRGWLRRVR